MCLCHAWRDGAAVPVAGCGLCKRPDNDPYIFGGMCRRGCLRFHENCLVQQQVPVCLRQCHARKLSRRGAEHEGFFGFLLPDIQKALQRVARKVNRATCPPLGPRATWLGGSRRALFVSKHPSPHRWVRRGPQPRGTPERPVLCRASAAWSCTALTPGPTLPSPQKCCICGHRGASVRCQHENCSHTFHFPCGRERGCVSQFFGEYR
ncbi:UNVERIFIED_CONTAM: hypothetical protein H355_017134 [Colinus virginianus]|nr:hypothetical protein H355_005492 [Colinus virginianus]OXB71783.1 hypothetical protein H355_017134 [Colinus virginianus]